MDDLEQQLLEIQAAIASMSAEEKKAMAMKLCGLINETAFDMVAAHSQGASPERVLSVAGETLQRGLDAPRVLN